MTAEATRAPDKRLQAGAVPAIRTTLCYCCDMGNKPIRMKRQHIHYINHRIFVCHDKGIKPMLDPEPYKRGS